MSSFPSSLPQSTAVPLRGGPLARWGVLAPGRIAEDWVATLHTHSDQRVHAVASRSGERAADFAARHGIPRNYDSYEALLGDPEIDVVYLAAPHAFHLDLALAVIAAGKHVLIEKPIAMNAAQAGEIAAAAASAGVFAGEAMWTRYLPRTTVIDHLLRDGALGEPKSVTADFGHAVAFDPTSRMFDPALGGGALLDLGVYSIWFAHFVLGAPRRVVAAGELAPTGVDAQASLLLDYPGAQALVSASVLVETPVAATIGGTAARIRLDSPFVGPGGFTLRSDAGSLRYDDETGLRWREGLAWQATAVASYLAEGRTDSPLHPLATAVAVLETIDEARRQLGAA